MKRKSIWHGLALISLLIFGTLTKSWAADPNGPQVRRFTPLASVVKSGFIPTLSMPVGPYWMAWEELVPAHQNLLIHLTELPPDKKKEALELVHATPPKPNQPLSDRFRSLILLGLGDEDTWIQVAREVRQGTLLAQLTLDYLPHLAPTLASPLKDQVLKEVTLDYKNLSKGGFKTQTSAIAPKRLADVYIKHLLRGDLLIENLIQKGNSTEDAFKSFISQTHSLIATDDLYTAEEILTLVRLLRNQLAEEAKNLDDHPVTIGGSLPNGKAFRKTSDLDFSRKFPFNKDAQNKIESILKEYIFSQGHLSNCELKLSHVEKVNPLQFFGKKQTVAFEVSAKEINLITFGPNGEKTFYPLK